ncbi:Uncharacterized protein T310_3420 [Rasamsonia emersonii CBS 393.64]|uniref:Uncharacterized protein n=1 Tax=Rasamsonia emersonii (strain ATCC 16479 / CBS 393.64 / IMI 116815) TaxID=1408163 RepID=A0A0F4YW96_RASE3|nr:Uncharacterized protein T310_3420 [Rasamsonia emersonii CBS 393.64]KKA22572.1 Uncharacterized protein T310_3420 [Rasamsonia emersonii CBS 393.64]
MSTQQGDGLSPTPSSTDMTPETQLEQETAAVAATRMGQRSARIKNQASDLPSRLGTLDSIEKLTGTENYEDWEMIVIGHLKRHKIRDLIDSKIPRPTPDDEKYELWEDYSLTVGLWLITQVNRSLREEMKASGEDPEYADDVMNLIRRTIQGTTPTAEHSLYIDFHDTKRDKYATVEHFVNAFRQKFRDCNRTRYKVTARIASLMLLDQLEEDMPSWVNSKMENMSDKDYETETEFLSLCRQAIEKSRKRGQYAATTSIRLH